MKTCRDWHSFVQWLFKYVLTHVWMNEEVLSFPSAPFLPPSFLVFLLFDTYLLSVCSLPRILGFLDTLASKTVSIFMEFAFCWINIVSFHPYLPLLQKLLRGRDILCEVTCMLMSTGNSLTVQWLVLSAFAAGTCVQSLAGHLRSHKLHSAAKKEENMKYK